MDYVLTSCSDAARLRRTNSGPKSGPRTGPARENPSNALGREEYRDGDEIHSHVKIAPKTKAPLRASTRTKEQRKEE